MRDAAQPRPFHTSEPDCTYAGMADLAVEKVLQGMLLPHMRAHDVLSLRTCMCCCALSRALAMRGHAGWQACTSLFRLLH